MRSQSSCHRNNRDKKQLKQRAPHTVVPCLCHEGGDQTQCLQAVHHGAGEGLHSQLSTHGQCDHNRGEIHLGGVKKAHPHTCLLRISLMCYYKNPNNTASDPTTLWQTSPEYPTHKHGRLSTKMPQHHPCLGQNAKVRAPCHSGHVSVRQTPPAGTDPGQILPERRWIPFEPAPPLQNHGVPEQR
jgi:hypothetical protein